MTLVNGVVKMWLLWALLSAFFAAWIAILSKIALSHINVVFFTTIGSVVITIFLVALSFGTKQIDIQMVRQLAVRDWLIIGAASLVEAISWLFYFKALATGPVTPVVMIDRLSIVFTVIFAAMIFSTPITPMVLVGIICMIVGIILVSI